MEFYKNERERPGTRRAVRDISQVAGNNPLHHQHLKTSASLKQKGWQSKYGFGPADKWQTRQTWIIKQNDWINLLARPQRKKHQEADIVFPVI